jgi:RecB family exonuclease
VLRLKERQDPEPELTHLSFGNLVHKAMQRFAESDAKHATDLTRIEQCLLDELTTSAKAMFGPDPSVAVALQIEFARRRLRAIARWQANRTRTGWLIDHIEWQPADGSASLTVDGTTMRLSGRVDRIERHAESGRLAILDFKTGSKPMKPSSALTKHGAWKDLQLPLYRHLAKELGANDETLLGYVNISNDPEADPLIAADWTPEQLATADERAEDVVRGVIRGEFAELGAGPRGETTLASICGLNQFKFEDEDDQTETQS